MIENKLYLAQEDGSCCFVYAAANLLIHDGEYWPINPKEFDRLCKIALCEHGSAIRHEEVLRECKLDLEKTQDHIAVFKRGGILTFMHPIFNLHCMAVIPCRRDTQQVRAINSWLGPNVIRVGWGELEQFIPENRNNRQHWVRRSMSPSA